MSEQPAARADEGDEEEGEGEGEQQVGAAFVHGGGQKRRDYSGWGGGFEAV